MRQYLDLVQDILDHGSVRKDRTGVGTTSVFGRMLRFDMKEGFPAVTSKKLAWKAVVSELLWILSGSTNEHRLCEILREMPYDEIPENKRKTIWTANADNQGRALGYEPGELGPVYGRQQRNFRGIDRNGNSIAVDQINSVLDLIRNCPDSRRILVNIWNPAELDQMALPPCHYSFQFYVNGDKLSLMWNQRSVDTMLGLPFDIASYGLMLCIFAKMTNKVPDELICSLGDTHIYLNHLEGAKIQVERPCHPLPSLVLPEHADYSDIDKFLASVKTSDFVLENYVHEDAIPMKMAV